MTRWAALLLVLAAPALAQQPRAKRLELAELQREWDAQLREHAQVRAAVDAVAVRIQQKQQEHTAQLAVVNAAEKALQDAWLPWDTIPRSMKLKDEKRKLREISDQLARDNINIDQLELREKALRRELIVLSRPLVERLLEKADQARPGRAEQAQPLEAEALRILRFSEDLEAAQGAPDPPPKLPDLAEEVRGASAAKLEQLAEDYAANLRECERLIAELRPDEEEMSRRVRRLDRLVEDRAGGANAPQLRDRTRRALERVVELRQAFEARAARYRERVQALQAAAEEALRRAAEEQRGTSRDGPGGG